MTYNATTWANRDYPNLMLGARENTLKEHLNTVYNSSTSLAASVLSILGRVDTAEADIDTAEGIIEVAGLGSKGLTAERPADQVSGCMYFDTTLGQPIWYDGSDWVDATGTAA